MCRFCDVYFQGVEHSLDFLLGHNIWYCQHENVFNCIISRPLLHQSPHNFLVVFRNFFKSIEKKGKLKANFLNETLRSSRNGIRFYFPCFSGKCSVHFSVVPWKQSAITLASSTKVHWTKKILTWTKNLDLVHFWPSPNGRFCIKTMLFNAGRHIPLERTQCPTSIERNQLVEGLWVLLKLPKIKVPAAYACKNLGESFRLKRLHCKVLQFTCF